jgi:protein TonB
MPRDLFGHVTRPSISVGSRKWYTLPLSLISHSAIVLALVAIPILAPAVMPAVFADDDLTLIKIELPKPPALPPKPAPIRTNDVVAATADAAPVNAPAGIGDERPPVETADRQIDGIISGAVTDPAAIVAPPPVVKAPAQPVRVGGAVRTPIKTVHVNPVYPPIALSARIQGIVIIEATIAEDGHVRDARVLRSIPLLDQSALDAVMQWRFTPTTLNGAPVPVIMTVTVNFTFDR